MRTLVRGAPWAGVVAAVLFASLAPPRAAALPLPEMAVSAGTTVGVNGSPGSGGASGSLAFLWPFEERFAFGGVFYADDLGTGFDDLIDPNTGEPVGTVATLHRWGFGAGWRTEARILRSEARRWRLLWGAEFGYGRQERDVRGLVTDATSGLLVSTGPSFLWTTAGGHSFGGTVGWKHAFVSHERDADRPTDWGTLAFTWRWRTIPKE